MDEFLAHILVVDDDDRIRSLVKKYLNENDYLVTTANSAEDASEKIKILKFDLIILDIMMPGKSGLEFIEDHKKDLDTPIILLTAKGEANERVQGLEIGADDYLPKPFEPKELTLRIQNILNKTKKYDLKKVIKFENISYKNFKKNINILISKGIDVRPLWYPCHKQLFLKKYETIDFNKYYLKNPFQESCKALYHWSPVADELKSLDEKIVLNSMSLKWNLIIDVFKNLTKKLYFN